MQQFIYQEKTQEERIALLAEAKKAENVTYKRHLTDAEIDLESKRLAAEVKTLAAIEEEKKEANKTFKEQIDTTRAKMENISKVLLDGAKEVTERCFKVINIEGHEVGYYNVSGELVKVRQLIDDDIQMDIFDGSQEQTLAPAIGAAPTNELPQHIDNNDTIEDAEVVEE